MFDVGGGSSLLVLVLFYMEPLVCSNMFFLLHYPLFGLGHYKEVHACLGCAVSFWQRCGPDVFLC